MDNNRFPNLFWPVVLIGLGVIFLLSNMGLIEPISLNVLWQMWPVFLVLVGISLLFGRNRLAGNILSALLAVAVIAFLIFAPQVLEILPEPEMVTESFSEPLDDASSANVTLDFDRGDLTVNLLEDSLNLFEADVTHDERVDFHVSGSDQRSIRLKLDEIGAPSFGFWLADQRITADVAVAGSLPVDLSVNIGGGSAELNLTDLELTRLEASSGSGGIDAFLPTGDYPVRMSAGSGSLDIVTAEESVLDLSADVGSGRITLTVGEANTGTVKLESGSGSITVYVPEGTPVQVKASTGSGSVNVPRDFTRTAGGDEIVGEDGTWQTDNFHGSGTGLVLEVEVGSGSVRVVYQ